MSPSGEYYDGRSSDPVPVALRLTVNGLELGEHSYAWKQIRSVEEIASRHRIALDDDSVVLVDDAEFVRELRQALRPRHAPWKRGLERWSRLPLHTQLPLGLVAGGLFAGLLYAFFLQAYRLVPEHYDRHLGESVHARAMQILDTCTTPELAAFRAKALRSLASPQDRFPHRIVFVADPMANAFALPGGNIYLFRGLLETSETPDEILGVLAHEISHVEKRHGVQQMGRTLGIAFLSSMVIGADVEGVEMTDKLETLGELGSTLLVLKYSRSFEREADLEGLARLRAANLPAQGLGKLLLRLEGHLGNDSSLVWLSTHPTAKERLSRYQAERSRIPDPNIPNPIFDPERSSWKRIRNSCHEIAPAKTSRLRLPW